MPGSRPASPPRLLLLPGMGATGAMHRAATAGLPGVVCADWPDDVRFATLGDLAARCIDRFAITADDVVGGSSLGGMVATEIARRVAPRALVLIGSTRRGRAVAQLRLARLARPLATAELASLIGLKGDLSALCGMYAQVRPAFIRQALDAVAHWPGLVTAPCPVRAIHGRLDPIIPCRSVAPDETITLGGHFIALSHPRRVRAFLQRVLTTAAVSVRTTAPAPAR